MLNLKPNFLDFVDGKAVDTLDNLRSLLIFEQIELRYNLMTRRVEFSGWQSTQDISDLADTSNFSYLVSAAKRFGLPTGSLVDYVTTIAGENSYHPVADWINSKSWDGVSRWQQMCDTLVTDDRQISPELKQMLFLRWCVGAVMAVLSSVSNEQHGVLVLQGKQGIGKTKWVKSLCPVAGAIKDGMYLDPKIVDSVRNATSYWITELGELDGTFRKSDVATLKAFISQDADEYRTPYSKVANRYPRRTAFVASVNESQYLVDDTGNRRFWTIPVIDVNYQHYIDMQQFWSEIAELWRAGGKWWLDGEDLQLLNSHNADFEAVDPYREAIQNTFCWQQIDKFSKPMTSTQICEAIGYQSPDKRTATAVGKALNKLGLASVKKSIAGVQARYFMMPEIK